MTKELIDIEDRLEQIYDEMKGIRDKLLDIIVNINPSNKNAKIMVKALVNAISEIENVMSSLDFAGLYILTACDWEEGEK